MEKTNRIRLNKYLAQCGICSRRDADKLIGQGRVTVNGKTATPGQTVEPADEVRYGKKLLKLQRRVVVLAFNKPTGVICTERDAHAERILRDMIHYPERVTYAGRLDKDSEGLLLLTNDGDLIQAMMKGVNRHEKEYTVRVDKEITADFLNRMAGGIYLKELSLTTRKCKIEKTGKYTFDIVLTQGVNRQIRRMCEACGYRVRSLRRVRVMNIGIGALKPGEYRELADSEIRELYDACGLRRRQDDMTMTEITGGETQYAVGKA